MKVCYEIKAYKVGSSGNGADEWQFGSGKRAKTKAVKKANELWYTGKYEAVFVDAYNDEEFVDDECVSIPTE
jgi:hypothetical protein